MFAEALAREEGKTLREACGEVRRAAGSFTYFANQLSSSQGFLYEGIGSATNVHTRRRPVGVVGVISPWNYPLAIPAWKIAPALAFGNAVVFKPADLVPHSAWLLAQTLRDSGVPAGVFNLVMGSGSVVGERLVESSGLDAITFTGSTAVGERIAVRAARDLKKIQLEMGGKNPLVVLDDADLELAVSSALEAAYGSTGQRCTAASRIIVQQGIHDRFVAAMKNAVDTIVVGDARAPDTSMGPVVSEPQLDQVLDYVQIGLEEGAQRAVGGDRIDRTSPGFYMTPTLFLGTNSMRINREEIFGPVACVLRVEDLDEAIAVANDTDFGLTSGIITNSLSAANFFLDHAEAGMISVNRSPALTDLHVPFGGLKRSSYGKREQGSAARAFFTDQITVYTATT